MFAKTPMPKNPRAKSKHLLLDPTKLIRYAFISKNFKTPCKLEKIPAYGGLIHTQAITKVRFMRYLLRVHLNSQQWYKKDWILNKDHKAEILLVCSFGSHSKVMLIKKKSRKKYKRVKVFILTQQIWMFAVLTPCKATTLLWRYLFFTLRGSQTTCHSLRKGTLLLLGLL